jgi:type I restriction enzyme M protein
MNPNEIAAFLWNVADLIRDHFKRGKYQDVILPFTVLRRMDCVLAPTKVKVLEAHKDLKAKGLKNPENQLKRASGFVFYNTSKYDFQRLLDDPGHIAPNLRNYMSGFSENMREVMEKFQFEGTVKKLEEKDLLFKVVEKFAAVDLSPVAVDNHAMGQVFEELIRKFNEALDENPGEHFTPREIVGLMVEFLLAGDDEIGKPGLNRTILDPCCGTGGMLSVAREHILHANPKANVFLFGQEVNDETFAMCKADMYMKSKDGKEAENILFGSTLREDSFPNQTFDYLIANPPYGKDWKQDEEYVLAEAEKGSKGRFPVGCPPKSDGQMLFLELMLSKMNNSKKPSRVSIVMNGSPLFTGEAGSGASEIRRWVFENDWLEAIVALPNDMFYNTGISTYIWVLSNNKEPKRKGKVQLIDASGEAYYQKMRKSLGSKRNEMTDEHVAAVLKLYKSMKEAENCKIFKNTDFGYRRITVERPLRVNFQVSPERLKLLEEEKAFVALAETKKKGKAGEEEVVEGKKTQKQLLKALGTLDAAKVYTDQAVLEADLDRVLEKSGVDIKAPIRKAILKALSERDPKAPPVMADPKNPEPDGDLRDFENVPLSEKVEAYFDREVRPHVADAWINDAVTDEKDGKVGKVGYEIPFTRHFYKYVPPRPLDVIEAEIEGLEKKIAEGLKTLKGEN